MAEMQQPNGADGEKNGTRVPGTTHEYTDVALRSDLRLARPRYERKRYAIIRAIAISSASEAVRFLLVGFRGRYGCATLKVNYQLKITLKDVRPFVWRRVVVPAALRLLELHHVIQIAMGWEE